MPKIDQADILALLADELDAARAQLETLGVALAGDSSLAIRHIARLQALDHAGQRCATVAAILRSRDLHAASREAQLESIPARLRAAG